MRFRRARFQAQHTVHLVLAPTRLLDILSRSVSLLVALLAVVLLGGSVRTQCSTQWLSGGGFPGTNGPVRTMIPWDPDGPGPLSSVVAIGGTFTIAGSCTGANIAAYDPVSETWSTLGSGTNNTVNALTARPNGDLIAAGLFTNAGGVIGVNRIARWNGSNWVAMTSMNNSAYALATLSNGDVVVGGDFTYASGTFLRIAKWNGSTWSGLGSGANGRVSTLLALPNGNLIAGGAFTAIGGISANRVAIWNGTSWSALGSGMNNEVSALAVMPGGDIVAGGLFTTAGGASANYVARWDGMSWSALGTGVNSTARSLTTMPNGNLLVGGTFAVAGGVAAYRLASWDGSTWSAPPAWPGGSVNTLVSLPSGEFMAAGDYIAQRPTVARFDGLNWLRVGTGFNVSVRADGARAMDARVADCMLAVCDETHRGSARRGARTWLAGMRRCS
ncbi:MAG: hypothetical protein K8J09_07845, partial [Planctomycetes bacterium]|nr:hypothetical protein [Planctomycetota bacterium]